MDYEKAYKEALKRAKAAIDIAADKDLVKGVATTIFPELAESERIRQCIVETIKQCPDTFLNPKNRDKMLAYLEKQKEQKPVEIHIDNPNVQKFDPDVKITTSDSSADGKELLYVSNKSYNIGFRDGAASVKPAEWNEEDEDILNSLIRLYSNEYSKEKWPWSNGKHTYGDIVRLLKSLRPSWRPSEEQIRILEDTKARMGLAGYAYCPELQDIIDKLKAL